MTARETLIAASRMSLAEATTLLRSSTSATERRILGIRCHEPEAFAEICESAGIVPIGPPEHAAVDRGPNPCAHPHPMRTSVLQAYLDRWRHLSDVGAELGRSRSQVSRALHALPGAYRVERRLGAHGLEHRVIRCDQGQA